MKQKWGGQQRLINAILAQWQNEIRWTSWSYPWAYACSRIPGVNIDP